MQATAISKIKRRIRIIKVINPNVTLFLNTQVAVDRRNKSRWPAVRLAANRNPKAIGCANRLIDSIHTISGISPGGVPWGTRCLSRLLKARKNPSIFTLIHIGMANL